MAFAKGRAMKGSRWWLAIALILVLAVSLSAEGLRYWQGKLHDLGQVVPRVGEQRLEAAESLPEGTTLPGLRSSRPAFFLIQLGEKDDEPFAAVADVSDRLQADDAVYVDVDRDGDLAEESAVRGRRWDEYSLYRCWIEGSDEQGNTWRAEAGYCAPYPVFTVPAGQETTFQFGPPFTVALVANPSGPYRPGQTISFDTKVTGADGKTYTFTRNGQRTVTNPDFELALYERMHQKDVTVGMWREGVGAISVQLKLEE